MTNLRLLLSALLFTALSACSVIDPSSAEAALESSPNTEEVRCYGGDGSYSALPQPVGTITCVDKTRYVCRADGQWRVSPPVCEAGSCGTYASDGCGTDKYCECPKGCPCGGFFPHCMICNPD